MPTFPDLPFDDKFSSTLAGGRRLVYATEDGDDVMDYRADAEPSYARYQRMPMNFGAYRWRVLERDGSVHLFGQMDAAHRGQCSFTEGFAPLTSTTDVFGNRIDYEWETSSLPDNVECRIKQITFGANDGASLQHFARVAFSYDVPTPCAGLAFVSGKIDYRGGVRRVFGASRLLDITSTAFDPAAPTTIQHTRTVTLNYDQAALDQCTDDHAPTKLIASIDQVVTSINGPSVTVPRTTFTYGAMDLTWDTASQISTWQQDSFAFDRGI